MKIKSKATLLRRAEGHLAAERFTLGYYLTGQRANWKGCEIGCLAMPLRPTLAQFDARDDATDVEMARMIERQFGVCQGLQRVAEVLFMLYPDESLKSGKFVVRFVKALPEGVEVTDEMVNGWLKSRGIGHLALDHSDGEVVVRGRRMSGRTEAAFLGWLKRGCKMRNIEPQALAPYNEY